MLNLFPAEWTKLRSTASFWWNSALILVFGAFFGALFGFASKLGGMPYAPLTVAATMALITAIVVIVQASMTVTTEYRFGIPPTNFRVAPKRWQVAVAKLVLGAVLAALATFLGLAVAFTIGDLTAPVPANWVSNTASRRALWAIPLGMALITLFQQGVGWITRNTAGAVVTGMGMMLLIESIVGFIPRYGADVAKFLPFGNLMAFMTNSPANWTLPVSLLIFAVWAVAAWIIGVVLLETRDA
ncbi:MULTISPECIES: ABC transporter permease [unclassified Corynebacterium]|uniref:ABC transporter permease n=1 Tax=unclassified Corynebacterium TaxID=2624378 RepID=UPI001EF462EF|nr:MULTISPECIES: ABC transporter permease [unclassified Corynebacterium]MCG7290692.1 ABC transporter permease [Corynebacterium sp. ACRPZ]MCG7295195.1 ABC transporter permease [Corynebacterium sp. ACRPY]